LGLCFFRIAQEAQHNIAAHARARRVVATLSRHGDGLQLTVTDDGRGFDLVAARQGNGLGLASMDERARLLRGQVHIASAPQRGTTVHVTVPLDGEFGLPQGRNQRGIIS
jgi:signal transduction histidine kinase